MEDWLDLSKVNLEPVFSFTVRGDEAFGFETYRELDARADLSGDGISVALHTYNTVPSDRFLSDIHYEAVFVRGPDGAFSIQTAYRYRDPKSIIPIEEFESLREMGGLTLDRILVYTLPRWKEIATSPNPEARAEHEKMLERCKDTPEKRVLVDLLAKQ